MLRMGEAGENPSELAYDTWLVLNPGHMAGRRALSPLRQPWS